MEIKGTALVAMLLWRYSGTQDRVKGHLTLLKIVGLSLPEMDGGYTNVISVAMKSMR